MFDYPVGYFCDRCTWRGLIRRHLVHCGQRVGVLQELDCSV
jgi:hypothetical protein